MKRLNPESVQRREPGFQNRTALWRRDKGRSVFRRVVHCNIVSEPPRGVQSRFHFLDETNPGIPEGAPHHEPTAAGFHLAVSRLRTPGHRVDAHRCLHVVLRLRRLFNHAAPETGGLLRLLLVRRYALSAGAGAIRLLRQSAWAWRCADRLNRATTPPACLHVQRGALNPNFHVRSAFCALPSANRFGSLRSAGSFVDTKLLPPATQHGIEGHAGVVKHGGRQLRSTGWSP